MVESGFDYLRQVPVEKRRAEAYRIRKNHPLRVPIIVLQLTNKDPSMPILDKFKYLVPIDLTIGQFQYILRKRLQVSSEKALFLFADKHRILPPPVTIDLVYSEHASKDDGFLYLTLTGENTFG
jgi:GABA(A) receptor-associated protein